MRIYTFLIHLYHLVIRFAALFNDKARLWVNGRKNGLEALKAGLDDRPVIWMHAASLGEFEQGRPLLEELKQMRPQYQIVLTFFSPSGYELRKQTPSADLVLYLPMDTPDRAKNFIDTLRPDLAIFVKYEFWFNHLQYLQQQQVPLILIAAVFRSDQHFFKWYGSAFLAILKGYTSIFIQEEDSLALLQDAGLTNVQVAGDPRVDRVLEIAEAGRAFEKVAAFAEGKRVLVAGSTWPKDEALLQSLIENYPAWHFIIAPHEVHEAHLVQLENGLRGKSIRYSQWTANSKAQVLLIDNIGMLAALYRYGDVAYVGGGFGQGIHNLLEPAAHAIPVIYGPRHTKFREAVWLKEKGGGFALGTPAELLRVFDRLQNEEARIQAGDLAKSYLRQQSGATRQILDSIYPILKM